MEGLFAPDIPHQKPTSRPMSQSYSSRIMQAYALHRDALGLMAGKSLPPDERDKVLEEMVQVFIGEAREQFLKEKRPKKAVELGDAEWVQMLEGEPHLKGINVKREIAACQLWYRTNVSKVGGPSRRRIVNWLNKSSSTFELKQGGASYANNLKPVPPMPPEPSGWRSVFPDYIGVGKRWEDIDRTAQIYLTEQMALRLKQG